MGRVWEQLNNQVAIQERLKGSVCAPSAVLCEQVRESEVILFFPVLPRVACVYSTLQSLLGEKKQYR